MMRASRQGRGFTMIELLIATMLLVVVISGILLLFMNVALLNEANRNLTIALSHAQFGMEQVKDTIFAGIPAFNGTCWNIAALSGKGLNPLTNETVCFSVSGTTELQVSATVNWLDSRSRARTTTLTTLITEP